MRRPRSPLAPADPSARPVKHEVTKGPADRVAEDFDLGVHEQDQRNERKVRKVRKGRKKSSGLLPDDFRLLARTSLRACKLL